MRKAGAPGVLYARGGATSVLPKVEGDALGGVESIDLDKIYRSAASEVEVFKHSSRTKREHTGAHFP